MEKGKLKSSIKRLEEIVGWFDKQEEIDLEEGLKLVKEGVGIIKANREHLKKLENEFEKVKKELEEEIEPNNE